jgi:alpha-beta hydrolase superfamily lysophospholipase
MRLVRGMLVVVAVVVVAACAHTPNLPLRPDASPPPGSTAETITTPDGTQLLVRHWAPAASSAPQGAFVIMHGLKDHSARYADFATKLAALGFSVYAFDLRGHGHSSGARVAPDDWTDYVGDLDRFLTMVEQREPGKPVFLFGHSMGGAIAARTAEIHQPRIAGLILSGPALAIDAPPLLIAATRMTGFLMPRFPALKLDDDDFSSVPGAGAAIANDPYVSDPPAPARTAAGLVDGMRAIWADADKLTMPVLAMHGSADRLTAPSGSRALIERIPSTSKSFVLFPGFFHDLLHEPKHAEVEQAIVSFLAARVGPGDQINTFAAPSAPLDDRHLAGDPRGWTQAIEFAGGISRGFQEKVTRFGGEFALSLARPRPVGWHGQLTARYANTRYAVALKPVGVALRIGGAVVGLSGGGALLTDAHPAVAAGFWYEQPAGPLHVGIRADYEHAFFAGARNVGLLVGSLRVGGDRHYWPHAVAGVGPIVTAGWEGQGDIGGFVALVGLQLYGAD